MTKTEYKPIQQKEAEYLFSITIHDLEKLAMLLESIDQVREDEGLVQGLSYIAQDMCLASIERLRKTYLEAGLSAGEIEDRPDLDEPVVIKAFGGAK
ncbi:hypothetical protein SAMN05421880_11756 [Nitrosomonas nitrosa]|uniref:Uncharacterized protein n=1 Tax=Nitrosomonas nitrosa TaxID=52442 RepID=A0A1I4R4D2_9PROT|nr:hypothetical protein [Nitrosomonas nitrosa]SFM46846.1 hypothetical protein SAMN05421880_11756 [Nitrosomonas nitrosa]